MIAFLMALILLAVALAAINLRKTYRLHTPVELKRRARRHDTVAQRLYPVLSYGTSLYVLLWIIILLPLAGAFALLSSVAPPVLAFILVSLINGYAFAWAPSTRVSNVSVRLAVLTAPALSGLLKRIAPLLIRLHGPLRRAHHPHNHTRLYEHEDLLDLLSQQKHQSDSRIPAETLDMLSHMLTFGVKQVRDCMVSRSKVRVVAASEPIGPLLMKELHETGFRRFPVFGADKDDLVGILDLDVITDLKHTGTVVNVMDRRISFLHEDHPLEQVIDAFYKTGSHLFIVINEQREFAGIITIEDVLVQIVGYKIQGDFDRYDSRDAVGAYKPADSAATASEPTDTPTA